MHAEACFLPNQASKESALPVAASSCKHSYKGVVGTEVSFANAQTLESRLGNTQSNVTQSDPDVLSNLPNTAPGLPAPTAASCQWTAITSLSVA